MNNNKNTPRGFGNPCARSTDRTRQLTMGDTIHSALSPRHTNMCRNNTGDSSSQPTISIAGTVNEIPDAARGFNCSNCERVFSTKTGLGVHMRRAHPNELDAERLARTPESKVRWSVEELRIMARKEAELLKTGVRFINVELTKVFRSRTLEAIKKVRKRADYLSFLNEYNNLPDGHSTFVDPSPGSDTDGKFIDFILQNPPLPSGFSDSLMNIVNNALNNGKDETMILLSNLLRVHLPLKERTQVSHGRRNESVPLSRRQQRRKEYAKTQRNFTKHQGRCIKSLLEGSTASCLGQEIMEPYWRTIMERATDSSPTDESLSVQECVALWDPINIDEVNSSRLSNAAAPGPDGIAARKLNAIPKDILVVIFNIIMWCGRLPTFALKARTVFVAKKTSPTDPGEFRPITVPSVLCRQLHSIMSKRILRSFVFDSRQRAFIPGLDGCTENAMLMDMLLRDHHDRKASFYMALLDISKAFDSVSHGAILGTLKSYGFPMGFINYIKTLYKESSTQLCGDGWVSSDLHPGRGVKQGDPLSPIIFNLLINRLLCTLPAEVGSTFGGAKIGALAFADDLVMTAQTANGLQMVIDHTHKFLMSCGMSLNTAKCLTVSIKHNGKLKTSMVDGQSTFSIAGRPVPALKRTDDWSYLGINFTAEGRCKYKPHMELDPKLQKLKKAPLKPQQRLHALRTVLIPQLYHKLALGCVLIGSLNKTDRIIRNAVRGWLRLPHDVPTAFFHASIGHGGLGIPSLRWVAPWLRMQRLNSIQMPGMERSVVANTFIRIEIDRVEKRLTVNGRLLRTKEDIDTFWSDKLYSMNDGFGLREAGHAPYSHRWLREPTKLLSGKDYVTCARLRINALPSKSRTSRGREALDRNCRAGCEVPETVNHIVQSCHRTHNARIKRHNAVAGYIKRGLQNRGYTTIEEPTYRLPSGRVMKPDLVASKGEVLLVLDAQVNTDAINLELPHNTKITKYSENEFLSHLGTHHNTDTRNIKVVAATLNWRGIWCKESVTSLLSLGILTKRDTAVISTRVAIGSICCYKIFNNTTLVRRVGIG